MSDILGFLLGILVGGIFHLCPTCWYRKNKGLSKEDPMDSYGKNKEK